MQYQNLNNIRKIEQILELESFFKAKSLKHGLS